MPAAGGTFKSTIGLAGAIQCSALVLIIAGTPLFAGAPRQTRGLNTGNRLPVAAQEETSIATQSIVEIS